ncbi:MAG: chorismate synthase [Actinobacteria bacterium]|nr:chorismate synthase [Actinomycetota bacterium]
MAIRYLTAGESHGPQLTAILEGCPSGVPLSAVDIDRDLARRQLGYGRGGRMQIEQDRVSIVGGVRYGKTTGAPVALTIVNRDAAAWGDTLSPEEEAQRAEPVRIPRPGHADLGGALLYGHTDLRDVIERASARETAARVACGAVARRLLEELGCHVVSHVIGLGDVRAASPSASLKAFARVDENPVRCLDAEAARRMQAAIDRAAEQGDTLGGVFEVVAFGVPSGLGSYVQADRRLGARLAAAVMSIPAIKGVELGGGFALTELPGSRVHDQITWRPGGGYGRVSNRAGGVEGGMSTGEPVVVRAAMKPIATLRSPLGSVDMGTHEVVLSRFERSDVCAVPAAAVVGEAAVALVLADAVVERFGDACLADVLAAVRLFGERIRKA